MSSEILSVLEYMEKEKGIPRADMIATIVNALKTAALKGINSGQELKIDIKFVRDLGHAPQSSAVVSAIIALARSLGLRVIAEGVENLRQMEVLHRLGCGVMQGFLFSRPMAADAVQAWLMRQARSVFQERLNHFAPQLGVTWTRLSLSSASTRWGSARTDGHIRLNWRLIHFKLDIIDYVAVHELSHLRVMDHSPRFWDTVRTIVPDYAELRGQLKDEPIPRW